MSVSGARAAVDFDLDEFERRLRAAGAPSAVEDPLAELARLVEASRPKGAGVAAAPPVVAAAPAPPPPPIVTAQPLEAGALRPAFDDASDRGAEDAEAFGFAEAVEPAEPTPEHQPTRPASRRSSRWLWTVSALAIAGVAMIGAVFALRGGLPGVTRTAPFIAAAEGPTKVQPPSDATVSTSSDAGANLLKDDTQANKVKVVSNEEQPVDLNAQTASPPPAASAAADAAGGPVVRGTVDTPVVVMSPPPAPGAASPFPEPKPVRTISLRPDGTPIPNSVADASASQTPPAPAAQEPPKAQAKSAAKAPAEAGSAQASTPKIDLPTKLSPPKSSARVVVAKTDTTVPGEAAGEPAAPAKSEKPAKAKAQEAAAEPGAAEPATASSGNWAVQLAAPRSEAEAQGVVSKLNEKYAAALGGSALGVHKATVNGDTIYRVRVTGLSKADAASLCARIKGDGGQCFVAK